jgi:hypothetical protein
VNPADRQRRTANMASCCLGAIARHVSGVWLVLKVIWDRTSANLDRGLGFAALTSASRQNGMKSAGQGTIPRVAPSAATFEDAGNGRWAISHQNPDAPCSLLESSDESFTQALPVTPLQVVEKRRRRVYQAFRGNVFRTLDETSSSGLTFRNRGPPKAARLHFRLQFDSLETTVKTSFFPGQRPKSMERWSASNMEIRDLEPSPVQLNADGIRAVESEPPGFHQRSPRRYEIDSGREFSSQMVAELFESLGADAFLVHPASAQGSSAVERLFGAVESSYSQEQ